MQNFRPKLISKIRDFGQNSAIFDSDNPREVNNEFGDTKTCFWGLWNLFGAGRKFFDHPAPKSSILGCRNFCKIAFFGLISPVFDPGGPKESQTGFFSIKNFLQCLSSLFDAYREHFTQHGPKRSVWGAQKFLRSQFWLYLVGNVFWTIFWISKESYLEC